MDNLFSNLWVICSVICGNWGFGWINLIGFYQIGWFLMFFWQMCEFCKKIYAQCKNNEKIVLFLWHQQQ